MPKLAKHILLDGPDHLTLLSLAKPLIRTVVMPKAQRGRRPKCGVCGQNISTADYRELRGVENYPPACFEHPEHLPHIHKKYHSWASLAKGQRAAAAGQGPATRSRPALAIIQHTQQRRAPNSVGELLAIAQQVVGQQPLERTRAATCAGEARLMAE